MIQLNDYLYSGDTLFGILNSYTKDLREHAIATHSPVDMAHCNFLIQIHEMLTHNEFLTAQSQKMRELYQYIASEYPYLAFTFKGRIKSLIRAESKFNGYIVEYVYEYYKKYGTYPSDLEMKDRLTTFRDLIAYRIVLSVPKRQLAPGETAQERELRCLYDIANILPNFMEERGFTVELSGHPNERKSLLLHDEVKPYYRDYVASSDVSGYQSLHITLFDNIARCYVEVQLRTKSMDDHAEIGGANHFGYEKRQEEERSRRGGIPKGECVFFDEAYERVRALQRLELADVDVNMFAAIDNYVVNDCCGLYRGRLILPYEHLAMEQTD